MHTCVSWYFGSPGYCRTLATVLSSGKNTATDSMRACMKIQKLSFYCRTEIRPRASPATLRSGDRSTERPIRKQVISPLLHSRLILLLLASRIWRALHESVNFVHDPEKQYKSLSVAHRPGGWLRSRSGRHGLSRHSGPTRWRRSDQHCSACA